MIELWADVNVLLQSRNFPNYCKTPNNSRGVYLFQLLNRPGGNLGQAFKSFLSKIRDENVINFSSFSVNSLASCWEIALCLLQVKLFARRKRFSRPALAANSSSLLSLAVAYICFAITLIILWDALSWRARFLITNSSMFISGSSLAFFLPPPGSLTLLLSSSDSSVLFFHEYSFPVSITTKSFTWFGYLLVILNTDCLSFNFLCWSEGLKQATLQLQDLKVFTQYPVLHILSLFISAVFPQCELSQSKQCPWHPGVCVCVCVCVCARACMLQAFSLWFQMYQSVSSGWINRFFGGLANTHAHRHTHTHTTPHTHIVCPSSCLRFVNWMSVFM